MMKKWKTKCNGKTIKHGQKGARVGKIGSKKANAYCSRSWGIAKKYADSLC